MFVNTLYHRNKQINEDQMIAIRAVLQFQRERFITFQDRKDIINQWKLLTGQLITNFMKKSKIWSKQGKFALAGNDDNYNLDLEIIDYLISGGVEFNDKDKELIISNTDESVSIQDVIKNGENNWKLKSIKDEEWKEFMPDVLPYEINKLILFMLTL